MAQKIDLQSSNWCDMVFEGRNKDYGAYKLRSLYSRNATRAIIIAIVVFALCTTAPLLAGIVGGDDSDADVNVDMETELANVEMEEPEELPPPPPDIPPPPPAVKQVKFTPPKVVPQEEVEEDDAPPSMEELMEEDDVLISDRTEDGLSRYEVEIDPPKDGEGTEKVTGEVVDNKVYDFASIEKRPDYPDGGVEGFRNRYVNKNLRYPSAAAQNNIEGTVFMQFTIEKDGSVTNVKVVRGQDLGGGLADEALRVISKSPDWIPGEQNGRPVRVSYTIPVIFRLQR